MYAPSVTPSSHPEMMLQNEHAKLTLTIFFFFLVLALYLPVSCGSFFLKKYIRNYCSTFSYSRSERSEWSEFCVQKCGVKKSCPRFRPLVSLFVRSSGAEAPGLTSEPIFNFFYLIGNAKTQTLNFCFFEKKNLRKLEEKKIRGVENFFFRSFFWIALSLPYSGHVKFCESVYPSGCYGRKS